MLKKRLSAAVGKRQRRPDRIVEPRQDRNAVFALATVHRLDTARKTWEKIPVCFRAGRQAVNVKKDFSNNPQRAFAPDAEGGSGRCR